MDLPGLTGTCFSKSVTRYYAVIAPRKLLHTEEVTGSIPVSPTKAPLLEP